MQLKSDAGNLDSQVTLLGHSYFIRPVSLGLVALLKMPKHFRMLIVPWPWEWGLPVGGSSVLVVAQLLLQGWWYFPLLNHSWLPGSSFCKCYSKVPISVSLRLMELFLCDCRIFCSHCRFLRR